MLVKQSYLPSRSSMPEWEWPGNEVNHWSRAHTLFTRLVRACVNMHMIIDDEDPTVQGPHPLKTAKSGPAKTGPAVPLATALNTRQVCTDKCNLHVPRGDKGEYTTRHTTYCS